jgi:catechol 2,3-dioxygenase-like lactoylglutathione lyase family enzyme
MIELDHLSLGVRGWQAARDWYRDVLGLHTEFERPDVATVGSRTTPISPFPHRARRAAPRRLRALQLDDVEQTHRELTASGIAFWGYGAELTDPDGNSVRLWDARTMREKGQR